MERIGFFGGCFNPPNNLHIEIANNLIKEGKLDKVIFVPVNDYYKKVGLIEAKHRLNMLKIAINYYNKLDVDDIEIKENKPLYAVDAFEIIQKSRFINKDNKDDVDEIYYIMGSDNFKKMPTWKDYDTIKDKYNYIVIDRKQESIPSTRIRKMILDKDEEVKRYLDKDVYKYIIKNNLYRR